MGGQSLFKKWASGPRIPNSEETHLFNKKPGNWWEKKSGLNEGE